MGNDSISFDLDTLSPCDVSLIATATSPCQIPSDFITSSRTMSEMSLEFSECISHNSSILTTKDSEIFNTESSKITEGQSFTKLIEQKDELISVLRQQLTDL